MNEQMQMMQHQFHKPDTIQCELIEEKPPQTIKMDNQARLSTKCVKKPEKSELALSEKMEIYEDDSLSQVSNSNRTSRLFQSVSSLSMIQQKTQSKTAKTSVIIQKKNQKKSQQQENSFLMIQDEDLRIEKLKEEPVPPRTEDDIKGDELRLKKEMKMKEKMIDQQKIDRIKQKQVEYEESRMEKIKQTKNKEFTYDYDGNLLFIKKASHIDQNLLSVIDAKQRPTEIISQQEIQNQKGKITKIEDFKRKKYDINIVNKEQEFKKQPELQEAMPPVQGVKIQYESGFEKEGTWHEKENGKMTKKGYADMVSNLPNRPVTKYNVQDTEEIDQVKSLQKLDNLQVEACQIQNQHQQKSIIHKKYSNINIENKSDYNKMMEEESFIIEKKGSTYSVATKTHSNKKAQFKVIQHKKPHTYTKTFEKMQSYNKNKSEIESITKDTKSKLKVHEIIEDFDKELLNQPGWGNPKIQRHDAPKNRPPTAYANTKYKEKSNNSSNPYLLKKQKVRPMTASQNKC